MLLLQLGLRLGRRVMPSANAPPAEPPAGEEDHGGYVSAVYSPEQQSRLGVDAQGQPANGAAAVGEPQPMCKCDAGWSGAQCESHDACLSVSCGTNGRCHQGTCECLNGWSGQDCSVDPCARVASRTHRHSPAGVCHSDIHFYQGSYLYPLPAVLGHESAGIVALLWAIYS